MTAPPRLELLASTWLVTVSDPEVRVTAVGVVAIDVSELPSGMLTLSRLTGGQSLEHRGLMPRICCTWSGFPVASRASALILTGVVDPWFAVKLAPTPLGPARTNPDGVIVTLPCPGMYPVELT